MADYFGKLLIFAVASEQAMAEFQTFAQHEDAPNNITEVLASREKLAFFFSEQELQKPPAKWHDNLYPVIKQPAASGFYYALIQDVDKHIPAVSNIVSYQQYLEKL